jgi:hypothetical protein
MLIWLGIVPLAILNGALREGILDPLMGSKLANPVSCAILCLLIYIVSIIYVPRLGKGSKGVYIKIGLLWVFATIIFETVLSLLMGMFFKDIITAYNVVTGNYWLLVVVFIGFAPTLAVKNDT